MGENPFQHKGEVAEKRSVAHHGREIYGAQFTHHKIMPILLLFWARLCKEQRNKSHPSFCRVSSVKKHCLSASHTSGLSPLPFDLGVVKRQELGRRFLGARIELYPAQAAQAPPAKRLRVFGVKWDGECVSEPARVEQW